MNCLRPAPRSTPQRYFIVIPDGIGRGGSSKPSDGLRMKFPHYRYVDMVVATHRLLTEHLGLKHLRLVLGCHCRKLNPAGK